MRPAALLVALLLLPACGGGGGLPRPRNVVVVAVDTLRADHLGLYGREPSPSPHLDRFAREAVVFERAHSHASWTLPSFASVLTSLYSSTHGCWNFESRLSDDFETLTEVFQAAGFDTHGVASHVYFNADYGLQQGFDTFDDELAHKRSEAGWTPVTSPLVTDKALGWLRGRDGDADPFYLWVHYFDPHLPYLLHGGEGSVGPAPDEHAGYLSEIAFTDRHVGRLLDGLAELGLAEDTVVVFLSDHGEAFEEHPGIRRHSYSLYVEEVRIPLVLRVPGVGPRRVTTPVRSVDLRPTLLELFGLRSGQPSVGVSLVPALHGRDVGTRPLVGEIRLKDGHHVNALVRGRWKLVENVSKGTHELYDVEADPDEQRDLAGERPELVRELAAELAERIEAAALLGERFAAGGTVELDEATRAHLRELGYAGDE